MSSKDNPSQVSGQSDDRNSHKGDVGHTLLIGSTRHGKCVQGVTVIAAHNEVATTIRLPTA